MISDMSVQLGNYADKVLNRDLLVENQDDYKLAKVVSIMPKESTDGQMYLRFTLKDMYGRTVMGVRFDNGDLVDVSRRWAEFVDKIVAIQFNATRRYQSWSLVIGNIGKVDAPTEMALREICFNGVVDNCESIYEGLLDKLFASLDSEFAGFAQELKKRDFFYNLVTHSDDALASGRRGGLVLIADSLWEILKHEALVGVAPDRKGKVMLAYVLIKCFVVKNRPSVMTDEQWKIDCIKKSDVLLGSLGNFIHSKVECDEFKDMCQLFLTTELGFNSTSSVEVSTVCGLESALYSAASTVSKMDAMPRNGMMFIKNVIYKK